jgi:hypothetical protein
VTIAAVEGVEELVVVPATGLLSADEVSVVGTVEEVALEIVFIMFSLSCRAAGYS